MTALVGTGLATLVVSLTGVASLSGDLQAAAVKNTTPALTPGEELRDTTKREHDIILKDACDKKKHHHGAAADQGVLNTTPTVPVPTTPSSREF